MRVTLTVGIWILKWSPPVERKASQWNETPLTYPQNLTPTCKKFRDKDGAEIRGMVNQ